ncbi:MAG TPA: EthD family reductase [Phototrophicaceae bacterium]|jgi:uncharacterized protein (TIGR02118 family)|nr:EthD family reductase [Phototrophicaceae bacterium]
MFKFMLIFYQPHDLDTFENSYQDLLALVERMPEIQRRQVIHVAGGPTGTSKFYRILEVYYADETRMNQSLMSPAGQEAGKQIQTFAHESFELLFADVYEESGGQTPTGAASS